MKKYVITEEMLTDIELRLGSYYGFEDIRSHPLEESEPLDGRDRLINWMRLSK